MDGSTLQKIKTNLLNRLHQIDSSAEREKEIGATLEMVGNQAEMIDLAQTIEQIDRDSSLAEQERREIIAIEHALAKMAMGSFGVCEDCEEEIPSRRLLVLPQARLCAKCQEFEEKQQVRTRGIAAAGR
jgi:DnaK suppressor protein